MLANPQPPRIHLPKSWQGCVKSAVLHAIVLIERFILSLKNGCTHIILVPLRTDAFQQELTSFSNWCNQSRPHSSLNGKTPHEVFYHDVLPACERPRYEPRARWPRSALCAAPHAPVAGHCGTPI